MATVTDVQPSIFDSVLAAASTVGTNVINAWGAAEVAKYNAVPPAPVYQNNTAASKQPKSSTTNMLLIGGAVALAAVMLLKRG